jgi:hypothetical protein
MYPPAPYILDISQGIASRSPIREIARRRAALKSPIAKDFLVRIACERVASTR